MMSGEWAGRRVCQSPSRAFILILGDSGIPSGSDSVDRVVPGGTSTIETRPITTFGGPIYGESTFKYSSLINNLDGNIGHSFAPGFAAYAGVRYMRLKRKTWHVFPL